jgi:hypothetical protein
MNDNIVVLLTILLIGIGIAAFGKLRRRHEETAHDPDAFYDNYPAYNPDGTQYRGPDNPRAIPGTRQAAPADWTPTNK